MKKISLCLIAFLFSAWGYAQEQSLKTEQSAQQTVISMFDALSNRDSVSLKLYCTTDILLLENGQVWNMDTLIRYAIVLNTAADFKRSNTFDFIHTTLTKNTAWVSYNLHSAITRNGKHASVHWMETVVLVKEKKDWKIQLLHSTLIKRN